MADKLAAVAAVEIDIKEDVSIEALRQKRIGHLFPAIVLLSIIINLDGGAVPASLIHIQNTFQMPIEMVALVGTLLYQGIALGCLLVGPLLNVVSPTRATQCTLVLNMAATFCFGGASSKGMLLGFRASVGLLQAIPAVYFPVWVDEFAPEGSTTSWMAAVQGASVGARV